MMELLINKHVERLSQCKISHDIKAKPKKPVVSMERLACCFSHVRFQLTTIFDDSVIVGLEGLSRISVLCSTIKTLLTQTCRAKTSIPGSSAPIMLRFITKANYGA